MSWISQQPGSKVNVAKSNGPNTSQKSKNSNPIATFSSSPKSNGVLMSGTPNGRVSNPRLERKPEKPVKTPPKFSNDTKTSLLSPLSPSSKPNKKEPLNTSGAARGTSIKERATSFEPNNENISPIPNTGTKKFHTTPSTRPNDITPAITHPERHGPITTIPVSPSGTMPRGPKPGRGLKNLGNTCFMNCILQCLSHTIPLREYFVSSKYKPALKNQKKGSLSAAFTTVMDILWNSTYTESVTPYDLKQEVGRVAPRFMGYSQHDAQEFMRFLLNEVHEEINKADVKGRQPPADDETLKQACARFLTWEDSRVSELFCGMLSSVIRCQECMKKSTVYDPFMDLALPIPKSTSTLPTLPSYYSISYDSSSESPVELGECFKQFIAQELLDQDERPYCNKCKKSTVSTKQLSIAKLPEILVIQLKRFSGYSVRRKLSTPVKFEETWTLEDESRVKHHYEIYATVNHSGGIYGGHYRAFCKYDGQWRCFNDSVVHECEWKYVKSQEAYMLFYKRVFEIEVSPI